MSFYVYILASRRNGTLYTGMTEDLVQRGLAASDWGGARIYQQVWSEDAGLVRAA